MGWKYIMIRSRSKTGIVTDWPVIFPDKMVHAEVAGCARMMVPVKGTVLGVVSAGKIEHLVVEGLGGDSETLSLKSRPDEDTKIIEMYSYLHGIET